MKSSFGYLFGFILACLPSLMWSQNQDSVIWTPNAEVMITESSEPVEDVYLDDVVRRTMIFENRVLTYEPLREADIP